jgi:predicted acetyltransferase
VEQYLHNCCDVPDVARLGPDLVPQTVYWMLDADGLAVGIIRVCHYLNDKLRVHGGHIGYFVRRDQRDKEYAKEALWLALIELEKLGEKRALLTALPDNVSSVKAVEGNGGQFDAIGMDPETGNKLRRYWIELKPQPGNRADSASPHS